MAAVTGPMPGLYRIDGGELELLADADRHGSWLLLIDGVPQSHIDLGDPTHLDFEYLRLMAQVLESMGDDDPEPARPLDIVHVGGAACTFPRYIATVRPRSRQLVLEIDKLLVDVVREQLPLKSTPGIKIRVTDGAAGITALPDDGDDVLVLDAFMGASMAMKLAQPAFLRQVARVLRIDGILLVNIADGAPLTYTRRMVATVRAFFSEVALIGEPAVLRNRRFGNLVVTASRAPLPIGGITRRAAGGFPAARVLDGVELERFLGGALPLTDDDDQDAPIPPGEIFGR